MRMLTSIATVSISGTLDQKLKAIAKAGFQGVEIFEADLLGFDGSPHDVRRMLDDSGLICTCYQPFRDFEGLPDSLRSKALMRAEAKFDLMEALGAPLLLVCSSVHREASGDRSRIVDDFRALGERAARRGLRIGYEALAWGRHIYDHRQAWDIVKQVDHDSVGIILDTFHSLSRKVGVESINEISPHKIFLIQVADAPDMPMGHLYWSRHYRCFPSQGDLPITDFVRTAVNRGYAGPLSLEIFNDRFREWSADQIAADGYRALCQMQDRANAGGRLAPRVRIHGIDFFEFAADADEVSALESLLAQLGFAHVGAHRSKAVNLWRQGSINFVINCDSNGWARKHWQIHGASVCALALQVGSAEAALERAAGLRIETFKERVAAGELAIPWIRGVGGALTYFTEPYRENAHWTGDFIERRVERAATLGLTQVDYFSQAMRIEEFLSWQLHYTSLFEVAKAQAIELSDTLGLIQSQPIESSDRTFRVVLNASSANQTLTARFVRGEMGAGVQHIALQTPDIMLAAARAKENGLPTLPVSPNYYHDLRARFALPIELVERLEAANVLYDRDEAGEYFHFFTRAFKKRFFFEIGERRGYQGYAFANTSVRLAAQGRYRPQPGLNSSGTSRPCDPDSFMRCHF
jgi:4-hydroxyphenylpyruvate dioxygenase